MKTSLQPLTGHFLSLLRVVAGALFLEHGTSKLLDIPPAGHPWHFAVNSMAGWSGILEFVGGILLVLGLFTRISAFLLSGEMAVAYFTAHAGKSLYPLINGGELAVLYCFVFLFFAAAGAGPWSLDRLRGKT